MDGTDIMIVEATARDEGFYALTADTPMLTGPIHGARVIERYDLSLFNEIDNKKLLSIYSKGSAFKSLGIEINGYLYVEYMSR